MPARIAKPRPIKGHSNDEGVNFVIKIYVALLATAASLLPVAPASAGLIGNSVVISRVQGGSIYKTVSTTVGSGFEYTDNFFNIDVSDNEILFSGGNFSIGSIEYVFEGLDFDNDPATANTVEGFVSNQIFGNANNPFDAARIKIAGDGKLTMSFANTVGGANSFARITLGAASPTGVPEPSTWAMMIGGFAFAGAASRRRRTSQAAVCA